MGSPLPNGSRRPHGTRSRYVAGCRCAKCRAANTAAYHERQARAKAAAAELVEQAAEPCPQEWTGQDGVRRTRTYRRACPGVDGNPCPTRSHLRVDSSTVCRGCRELLVWNGLVSAKRARDHLLRLSKAGVGRRSVVDAADVGDTMLQKILSGEKTKIRKASERAILGVDVGAIADHGLVDAAPTWKLIRHLIREGFTDATLAKRLGYKSPSLQIGKKKVLAKTALKIERFYRMIMAEGDDLADLDVCSDCGVSHSQSSRLEILRRLLPSTIEDLRELHPCLWGGGKGSAEARRLNRDLHSVGAQRSGGALGEWEPPRQ